LGRQPDLGLAIPATDKLDGVADVGVHEIAELSLLALERRTHGDADKFLRAIRLALIDRNARAGPALIRQRREIPLGLA